MATAFTTPHAHQTMSGTKTKTAPRQKESKRGVAITFISDLIEDVAQKPLQPAAQAKHDMFREHINAMSISYFALIVLLIAASLPILAYVVNY
jgi:hypothetical protein